MIFRDEVMNMQELALKAKDLNLKNKIKVAVVCFLYNDKNELVLQRRGPHARDEVGKLEAIGGSVNRTDIDFKDAMKRELIEEAGDKAEFNITSFLGAQVDTKIDNHTKEVIDWIILGYVGNYKGELVNSEPDRCIGFEIQDINKFKKEDMAFTCMKFVDLLKGEIN